MSLILPSLRRQSPFLIQLIQSSPLKSTQSILNFSPLLTIPTWSTPTASRMLEGLKDILEEWIIKAVPKSKTTAGGKRMRSSNKGLKEQQDIVSCPSCGTPKRSHHLCQECHSAYRREFHQEAKQSANGKSLVTEA